MKKVLISTSSFGKSISLPLDECRKRVEVRLNPYGRKLTEEEFLNLTKDVDGVIAGVENITRQMLIKRPNISVISRCGIGLDNIDLPTCNELGIKVYNTPNAPVESVAEFTMTAILALVKNLPCMNEKMKNRDWEKLSNCMLKNKKVGIIGFGRIGQRVAELLEVFGVDIAYTDIIDKKCKVKFMDKSELISWADIITIHSSDCPKGNFILGEKEFSLIHKDTYIINTSRGRFIDEESLYFNLINGKITGAALDVFEKEPYSGKLCDLNNVILTPHIASSAKEARAIMEMEAVYNLFKGLEIK